MAAFLPSTSNVQGDVMQTLYLMKPPQYGGYNDASNSGNMVFVGPSGVVGQINNTSTNSNQPYLGVSLPSSLASATSSSSGQGSLLMDHMGGNSSYLSWSGGGNDLSFLPSSDLTQSIGNLGQNSISDIPAYSMQSSPSIREHIQTQSGPNKASSLPCQGLSLTLSSQHPVNSLPLRHSEARIANCVSEDEEGRYTNKLSNGVVSFRDLSQNPVLGSEAQNTTAFLTDERKYPFNPQVNPGTGLGNFLIGSKYLKVAHQLLEEVVNSGESNMKMGSSKHTKSMSSQIEFSTEPSSFIGSNSFTLSFGKEEPLQENQHKDGLQILSTTLTAAAEQGPRNISELTDSERQELQMKKAKLVAMLDEVDRRYRQYHNQMHDVVSSFQAAAGIGAAKTYTALPLQTISRYFRSLRDAIEGQIRATNRGLGESQAIQGFRRENAARLSFNDTRQQKCLQQFGMMQQQQSIWRPQRGLPEHAVSILRAWLFEHFLHPYPKDADKVMLAKQTGLTRSQVSNWFINARVRLWKPMVEEMYIQETARGAEEEEEEEEERESAAKSSERKSPGESASKGTSVIDDDIVEDRGSESLKEERNDDVFKELVMGTTSEHPQRGLKGGQGLGTASATRLNYHYQEEEEEEDMGLIMMRQVAKRAKNDEGGVGFEGMMMMMGDVGPNNSSRMFSNALHSLHPQESKGVGLAIADGRNQHQHHHLHQQVMMRHDGFETYQRHRENENDGDDDVGASRFGHFSSNPPSHAQSLAAISRYNSAGNSNNNVSLTLGLQNCDGGLSLSGAPTHPHHFFQSHMTRPSSSTAVVHEDCGVTEDYFKPCYR